MRLRSTHLAVLTIAFTTGPALSQVDGLGLMDGIWAQTTPPGSHIEFRRVAVNKREVALSIGFATIVPSDGTGNSNIMVSGTGFRCYYFYSPINKAKFEWELKSGDTLCPQTAVFEKDPP